MRQWHAWTLLAITACASAPKSEDTGPPATVYFKDEVGPTCPFEKVGTLSMTAYTTKTGEERRKALNDQVGKKARARGADGVIDATSPQLYTVVVARNEAEARRKSEPPSQQPVTGTLIKFTNPDCTR